MDKITTYNPKILETLKDKYPNIWQNIKYKNKEKWLTKEVYPTYKQLVHISKAFHIPFGYLFLDSLREKKLPVIHYRTFSNEPYQPSDELIDTLNYVKKLQEWAKDILIEWGHQKLPFAGKFDIKTDKTIIVNEIKKILYIKNNWAEEKTSWKEAFNFLIDKFEEAGIFVVVNGIVGNNTHRKLETKEFRGFVLYDEIAPFVFVNNNDFLSAKIFTIIHELVHILIGKSASFDLRELQSADDKIEKFCDKCTAEFLVPEEEMKKIDKIDYENLARQFKVSQIVIARRLLDIGKINKNEFFDFYNNYTQQEIKQNKSKGGDFYNSAKLRYSKKFLSLLGYALSNNQILYRDVYRLLALKPSSAENLLKKVV
ncbi:MAG: ImmA/IrrE family metallo-endopeptidase [Leptonema sp. (in: bacteria)]